MASRRQAAAIRGRLMGKPVRLGGQLANRAPGAVAPSQPIAPYRVFANSFGAIGRDAPTRQLFGARALPFRLSAPFSGRGGA